MEYVVLFGALAGVCGFVVIFTLISNSLGRREKAKSIHAEEASMMVSQQDAGLPLVYSPNQYPSRLGEYQSQPSKMPPAPAAPSSKGLFIMLGVIGMVSGLYLAAQVSAPIGIIIIALSLFSFSFVGEADERHAKNMQHRAEAQESWARTEMARVTTETVRHKAQRDADLQEGQHLAAVERTKADFINNQLMQLEARMKGELAPIAKKLGVTIDTILQYNAVRMINEAEREHKQSLDELELLKEWKQAEQKLRAADLLILAANQQIKELLNDYETYVKRLDQLEHDTTVSEGGRKMLRGQLEAYLNDIENRINTLRTRPVSSQNSEKARRFGEGNSNSGPDYPPENDEGAI